MKLSTLALALSMTLASTSSLALDSRVVIYSGNFDAVSQSYPSASMPGLAQISQAWKHDFAAGANSLALDRLPIAIDVGSVQLTLANPDIRITSQRYDFALPDQAQLLQQAIGQRVTVEQASGGSLRRFNGVLLAAGDGLTLRQDDGRLQVLSRYDSFELERAPENLNTRPTLRWSLESPRAGAQNLHVDYATGGMAWQAEYLIALDGAAQRGHMSLSGAAQVINRSGLDFLGSQLTLVAGSPARARAAAPGNVVMAAPPPMAKARMASASYDAGMEAQDSGEYHAYALPKPVDLPNGSMQRVSLLDAAHDLPFERRYEVGNADLGYRPSRPQVNAGNDEQVLPVGVTLVFHNDKASGLGLPLPNGRVRVFQQASQGNDLLGEAWLAHTAAGEKVELALGEAFDLKARRSSSDMALSDDRLSLSETIEVSLSNAKSQAVTINLRETLPRWQDWEITEASQKWNKLNAQAIGFDVQVPAQGSATVRYRVSYRWPMNVRP